MDRFVVYVLGETVSILSLEQNILVGIKITNRHIAANFERMFDGLWDASKKKRRRARDGAVCGRSRT